MNVRNRSARVLAAAVLCLAAGPAWAQSGAASGSYTQTTTYAETSYGSTQDDAPWPGDLNDASASEDAFAADRSPNRGVAFLASLGSTIIGAVVFPIKLAVGIVGGEVGGVAGAMSGGDERAAAGIWNVTTDGSYFVSPEVLEGQRKFHAGGYYP